MSENFIKISEMRRTAEQLEKVVPKIQKMEASFNQIASDSNINQFGMTNEMKRISDNLLHCENSVDELANVLKKIVDAYIKIEKSIINDAIDSLDSHNDSKNEEKPEQFYEEQYKKAMVEEFGFTEEEAELLMDAYKKFNESDEAKEMDNIDKINLFFSNMASLYSGYSSAKKEFNLMGNNPSTESAIEFFNDLDVDGNKLKDIVNNQHSACSDKKRDFVHECAIYSVMANDCLTKTCADKLDNIDALVGYKGDIYSKSMGQDDIKSDIAAVNIYNRMKDCEDGDIWGAMVDYNNGCKDGTINPSLEFLEGMGDGDAEKGMDNLIAEIDDKSVATEYLSHDFSDMSDKDGGVDECRTDFLNHLSKESGVNWK